MKKILFLLSLFFIIIIVNNTTVSAQNNTNSDPQRVSYQVFDSDDNLISSGFLPISETEANSRYAGYTPITLHNGEYVLLKNETNECFTVGAGGHVHMMFGLDTNGYASVQLININNGYDVLNSWQGYTGGFSFSATAKTYSYIYGMIKNIGSSAFTINWASIEISY